MSFDFISPAWTRLERYARQAADDEAARYARDAGYRESTVVIDPHEDGAYWISGGGVSVEDRLLFTPSTSEPFASMLDAVRNRHRWIDISHVQSYVDVRDRPHRRREYLQRRIDLVVEQLEKLSAALAFALRGKAIRLRTRGEGLSGQRLEMAWIPDTRTPRIIAHFEGGSEVADATREE